MGNFENLIPNLGIKKTRYSYGPYLNEVFEKENLHWLEIPSENDCKIIITKSSTRPEENLDNFGKEYKLSLFENENLDYYLLKINKSGNSNSQEDYLFYQLGFHPTYERPVKFLSEILDNIKNIENCFNK
jgi:hypothetical protein